MTDTAVGHHADSIRADLSEWTGNSKSVESIDYRDVGSFLDKRGSSMSLFAISNEFLTDRSIHAAISAAGYVFAHPTVPAPSLRAEFDELASRWRRETERISVMSAIVTHPAYQMIIGMGEPALPWIIEELRERPAFWFWALAAISRKDPARGMVQFEDARAAWLDWAATRGL